MLTLRRVSSWTSHLHEDNSPRCFCREADPIPPLGCTVPTKTVGGSEETALKRSGELALTHYRVRPDEDEDLERNLRRSKLDDYNRESKSCRHPIIFPPNHKAKRKPKITDANAIQLRKIAKIKTEMRKLRLTA